MIALCNRVEVCCPSLNRPAQLARLHASVPPDCTFTTSIEDRPRALTQIVNELFARSDADIVIMAADHLEFLPDCIDAVRDAFDDRFPDLDGVVGLNIHNLPRKVGVTEYSFTATGRTFIERFTVGDRYLGVFCPEYYHFYADTEFGIFADKMGKFHYEPEARVHTWHPNARNAKPDATYSASRSRMEHDNTTWLARRSAGLLWGESFNYYKTPK